ncbi:MAG: OsmC family protein [Bacteroidota bacterium]
MRVELKQPGNIFAFDAFNETEDHIALGASEEIGGTGVGFRPMQAVLAAVGGCSAIDVVMILRKQKLTVADLNIVVTGERYEDRVPRTFKSIHIAFHFQGDISPQQAERAIDLSLEKYCSVALMLKGTVDITSSFDITPA